MIIEDSENEDTAPNANVTGGGAFISSMTSTDGATRDSKGGLKFNKNTKRAREAEREAEAMELDELVGDKDRIREKMKKKAKKEVMKLGEEFRSKVGDYAISIHLSMLTRNRSALQGMSRRQEDRTLSVMYRSVKLLGTNIKVDNEFLSRIRSEDQELDVD